jgi:DHA2 family methylenomycin A resistance protein-like MFS transporter
MLIGLVVNIPFYGLIFVFSLYFQKINGLSPLTTGLAFVPMTAAVLPVNLLATTTIGRRASTENAYGNTK